MDSPTLRETLDQLGARTPEQLVALLQDPDDDTAARACWALGHLGDQAHGEVVLELLESERAGLWMQSAAALSLLECPHATQRLIALAQDRGLPQAQRTAAVYALAFSGDVQLDSRHAGPIRETFVGLLADPAEPPALRAQAAEGLANMLGACAPDTPEPAAREQAGRLLLETLRDAAAEVRFWSAFALGALGYAPALPALRELAARDQTLLPGWWTVGEEAADAADRLEGRQPPERTGRGA